LGRRLDLGDLARLALATATVATGVIDVDAPAGRCRAARVTTFAQVAPGALALLVDSFGWAALAVNAGDAASALNAASGAAVHLRAAAG
jgi:S-adenosylmethionine hydrolase